MTYVIRRQLELERALVEIVELTDPERDEYCALAEEIRAIALEALER